MRGGGLVITCNDILGRVEEWNILNPTNVAKTIWCQALSHFTVHDCNQQRTHLLAFQECATIPHVQVCHCSFTRPSHI